MVHSDGVRPLAGEGKWDLQVGEINDAQSWTLGHRLVKMVA